MYDVCSMFSTPFPAPRDHHVYITLFKMDGLGLADHEHWDINIKSTHPVLDYSETLQTSRLHEEASVARRSILWVGEWHMARSLPIVDLGSKPSL